MIILKPLATKRKIQLEHCIFRLSNDTFLEFRIFTAHIFFLYEYVKGIIIVIPKSKSPYLEQYNNYSYFKEV